MLDLIRNPPHMAGSDELFNLVKKRNPLWSYIVGHPPESINCRCQMKSELIKLGAVADTMDISFDRLNEALQQVKYDRMKREKRNKWYHVHDKGMYKR